MKCNNCCNQIKENEEIKDGKQNFCETCWKDDSWRRTTSQILLGGFTIAFVLFFLAMAYYLYRDAKAQKCGKKHEND